MADVTAVLDANRDAIDEMIAAAELAEPHWTTPRAPGKWSPQQVVEHVAIVLDEAAKLVAGDATKFPRFPFFVRPVFRGMFFNRVLSKGAFSNAKTFKAFDPASGPASPSEARARVDAALAKFDEACRERAAGDGIVASTVFGKVSVHDYARFTELHTRHHTKQIAQA